MGGKVSDKANIKHKSSFLLGIFKIIKWKALKRNANLLLAVLNASVYGMRALGRTGSWSDTDVLLAWSFHFICSILDVLLQMAENLL